MDKIFVIDFGGQYTHLITNRIRRLNVLSEIKHPDDPIAELAQAKGIILSGGPMSVYDNNAPQLQKELLELGIPILGLCFGHQLLVHASGGIVEQGYKEYGVAQLTVLTHDSLFKHLSNKEQVWMSHGDSVKKLPEGFIVIGKTDDCPYAAISNPDKKLFGFQFHPEVTHTTNGMKILENFISICQCKRDWTMKGYISSIKNELNEKVKGRKVFMLVSGGVDSTVAFTLLNQVLGKEHVRGVFIDNGLSRLYDSENVRQLIEQHNYTNLYIENCSDVFLSRLKEIIDPEEKRKIIGNTFIDVSNEILKKMGLNHHEWLLGQGTIYPDTIESGGTKNAALIKTHHNRVDLIHDLIEKGLVIEPLSHLYKDEVRELGIELGLPEETVWRHPFPGPGLGVRALCSNGVPDKAHIPFDAATKQLCEDHAISIGFLPIKSVGVQGDSRSYAHTAVVSGTQEWGILEKTSTYITNKYHDINRVVMLITPGSLPKLSLKKSYLTHSRLDKLRKIDADVMDFLHNENLMKVIWQMPVVLLPLTSDGAKECIVLRPVLTRDFMTASFARIPFEKTLLLAQKIMSYGFIDAVFYDITHKPPGTIEWE